MSLILLRGLAYTLATTCFSCNAVDYIDTSATDVVDRILHQNSSVTCNGSCFVQDFAVIAKYFVAEVETSFLGGGP